MSDATSDDTARTMMEVLASVEKRPVLCRKDVPGFIANRMQHALWREAISIVERGIADAGTVDEAVRYSLRPAAAPAGPHGKRGYGGNRPGVQYPRLHIGGFRGLTPAFRHAETA
ncbi:MAG: 3-hydroxyacyl-CoA dehydrogenase family protein [Enterocloster clostridioformis]